MENTSKKFERYKLKFPIGSIIKHKKCDLLYRIKDYKFIKDNVNYYGAKIEEFVILEVIHTPLDKKKGTMHTFDCDLLKEFTIINNLQCEKILNNKN